MRISWIKYRDWPIFYKIFIFFAIIIAVLFFLFLSDYVTYYRQAEANSVSTLQAAANQAANEIDTYLEDISYLTKIPLEKTLDGMETAYLLNRLRESTVSQSEISMLHKLLSDILDYKKELHSVFLFTPSGECVYDFQFTATTDEGKIYDTLQQTVWFQDLMRSTGKAKVLPLLQMDYFEDLIPRQAHVFSVGRVIRMVSSNQTTGAIIINTSIDYLRNIVSNMLSRPDQRIMIVDAEGIVIYDTQEENIGSEVPQSIQNQLRLGTVPEKIPIDGEQCLLGCAQVEAGEWKILNIIPQNTVYQQLHESIFRVLFGIAGVFVMAITVTFFITQHIVKPLKNLVGQMQNVDYENLVITAENDRKDEIGKLEAEFFDMTCKVSRLIKEKYADELEKERLEISMLQMQINPHFLYNTLESISMMAEINDDLEAANMAASLGRIMRYSLGSQSEFVLLSEEIYCLNEYIQLQKERLSNVEFDEHIDYTLYEQKTIRLLLQPIVENAITHGMNQIRTGGLISITGSYDGSNIVLEVSDNGKGMSKQDEQLLNDYINGKNTALSSIGLKNVNKRIKLYFGEAYGLHIRSEQGRGTSVVITLPFIRK